MSVVHEIEALLFLSPTPLSSERLVELTTRTDLEVAEGLAALARLREDSGLEVAEVAGGWTLRTRPEMATVCDRLRARPAPDTLSPAALETLAVIAYLEPISRPDISRLRGVSADASVAGLLERGLVQEAGRAAGGGAVLFATTPAFQERFGLRHAGDLPPLERFELTGDEAAALRARLHDAGHLSEDDTPDV